MSETKTIFKISDEALTECAKRLIECEYDEDGFLVKSDAEIYSQALDGVHVASAFLRSLRPAAVPGDDNSPCHVQARFVPDDDGGHVEWNGKVWRLDKDALPRLRPPNHEAERD